MIQICWRAARDVLLGVAVGLCLVIAVTSLALALSSCAGESATTPAAPSTAAPPQSIAGSPVIDVCHAEDGVYCVLNPAVSQATIGQTICRSGWTATVRPSVAYTDALKSRQLSQQAGLHPNDPGWTFAGTEEDHRMPLELGGAPRDPMNLSPEVGRSPNPKDRDESTLREQVCAGRLTLMAAQQQLVAKWLASYPGYRA